MPGRSAGGTCVSSDAIDAVEDGVGVEHDGRVVARRRACARRRSAVGVERELAAARSRSKYETPVAIVRRHALEQPRVQHHHHQPLRDTACGSRRGTRARRCGRRAPGRAAAGSRRRCRARPPGGRAPCARPRAAPRGAGTARCRAIALVVVRVRLAEVVGARGEHGRLFLAPEAPARLHEVPRRVVALRQACGERHRVGGVLGVAAVAAEALAEAEHGVGGRRLEQGIEDLEARGHRFSGLAPAEYTRDQRASGSMLSSRRCSWRRRRSSASCSSSAVRSRSTWSSAAASGEAFGSPAAGGS